MLRSKNKKKSGFSLIEIMVVIAIIALLGGVVGAQVMGHFSEARIKEAIMQIQHFDKNLITYKLRTGKYPTRADGGLQALLKPVGLGNKPVMDSIPLDPWKNEYLYVAPSSANSEPIVRTLGADGKLGGVDDNADRDSVTIKKINTGAGAVPE